MNRICVFCGSSFGQQKDYSEAAQDLGRELVERGLELVYGGAKVGLMGAVANSVIRHHGRVTGVIPKALVDKEVAHPGITDLRIVNSMHERKALMSELSCAFIALPGGLGTLEESFEILTWAQRGFHTKPCGLLDICDYYQHISSFLDQAVNERFVLQEHRSMLLLAKTATELLDQFEAYVPPKVEKVLDQIAL